MNIIHDYELTVAHERFLKAIQKRINRHGQTPHLSAHESIGICQEELYEVTKSVHEHHEKKIVAAEFLDLAVAAYWAWLSMEKRDD